ncbi:hypothetical protein [Knoellia sinensis]|uniref:hypothetical protein n=1 Tax=Knoellia sinensis TaxID=136100 RepID=UPI00055CC49D|nr:hypothetical protein [Knoellia sinensis]
MSQEFSGHDPHVDPHVDQDEPSDVQLDEARDASDVGDAPHGSDAASQAEVVEDPRAVEPAAPDASAESAPETGDLVIDAALRDLAAASEDDLDAQIEKGEQVQRTLQGRLSDLGG